MAVVYLQRYPVDRVDRQKKGTSVPIRNPPTKMILDQPLADTTKETMQTAYVGAVESGCAQRGVPPVKDVDTRRATPAPALP